MGRFLAENVTFYLVIAAYLPTMWMVLSPIIMLLQICYGMQDTADIQVKIASDLVSGFISMLTV